MHRAFRCLVLCAKYGSKLQATGGRRVVTTRCMTRLVVRHCMSLFPDLIYYWPIALPTLTHMSSNANKMFTGTLHKRPGPNRQCRQALMKTMSPILLKRHSLSQSHTMLGQWRCSKGWSWTCRHLWWQRCRVHYACQLFNLPIPARTTTTPHTSQ